MSPMAPPTDDEVSAYRDLFRAELDKRMDTKHPSASPSTEAHKIALSKFVERRNQGSPAVHPTGITFEKWLSYQPYLAQTMGSFKTGDERYYTADTVSAAWIAGGQAVADFKPTHQHADGGKYQMIGFAKHKGDGEALWAQAVVYRNAEGMMFSTDLLRWNARFVPISAEGPELSHGG